MDAACAPARARAPFLRSAARLARAAPPALPLLRTPLPAHAPIRSARLRPSRRSLATVRAAAAAAAAQEPAQQRRGKVVQEAKPGVHGKPQRGSPTPHGASATPSGSTNFSVFSANATGVSLVLYTPEDHAQNRVTAEVALDPDTNRTGGTWHVALPGLSPSMLYGFRVVGPDTPMQGHRFNADAVVLDPYAAGVASRPRFSEPGPEGNCWPQMAATLPAPGPPFDWEGTTSPNRPLDDLVIYECHVRGFTRHPSSGVSVQPGTYAAMVEKVPHLVRMGFNALELLPVHEFNEVEYYAPPPTAEADGGARVNFWGYSTLGFFAPMARYAAAPPGDSAAAELKALVRACHAAGVEVILDVVFNHTAEGNEQGPTVCMRGLDNSVYYMTAPEGQFYNYSGCGNTLNCNHPVVRRFIVDCLRHWAIEYRIDGFRFDLASILTRASSTWESNAIYGGGAPAGGEDAAAPSGDIVRGTPLGEPPLIDLISNDGVLRGKKLIAEAWDAGGLYQVGAFPHWGVWAEWNGKFRDAVRQFIKGTDGYAGEFAERMCGSPALYAAGGRAPRHSINFVTAHDGFSLADLVSYNRKSNAANGEDNRDGEEHNLSWNCGVGDADEGDAAGPAVRALRQRQMRNLLAALFLAQGVPMVCMGDEYGHTKRGNNNTYCHDSPLNWFDWSRAAADDDGLVRFVAALTAFRASRPALRLRAHPTGNQVAWHGVLPEQPDWSEGSRLVAFTLRDGPERNPLYIAFNTSHMAHTLTLPPPGAGRRWRLMMDTALPPPFDMPSDDVPPELRAAADAQHASLGVLLYTVLGRSTLLLEGVPEAAALP